MPAKEYLNRARDISQQIKVLKKRIEELRALERSIPGPNYDQIVVDRTRSYEAPFVKYIFKRMEAEEKLKELEEELIEVKNEIAVSISELECPIQQRLLRLRYLDFMTWTDISKAMNYGLDNIYRLHRESLLRIKYE